MWNETALVFCLWWFVAELNAGRPEESAKVQCIGRWNELDLGTLIFTFCVVFWECQFWRWHDVTQQRPSHCLIVYVVTFAAISQTWEFWGMTLNVELFQPQTYLSWENLSFSQLLPLELKNMLNNLTVGSRISHFKMSLGHGIIYLAFSGRWTVNRLLDPVMDHYSHRDRFAVQDASQSLVYKSQPALTSFILQLYEAPTVSHTGLEQLDTNQQGEEEETKQSEKSLCGQRSSTSHQQLTSHHVNFSTLQVICSCTLSACVQSHALQICLLCIQPLTQ